MSRSVLWLWSGADAGAALRSRDLATILRAYRRLSGLSQERLAHILGYDKTYISMIETRRRVISDAGTLRQIAHTLGVPTHVLGVTESDDSTFVAMLQFADSILTLAEVARKAGRALEAINELWPLVARLEARATEGILETRLAPCSLPGPAGSRNHARHSVARRETLKRGAVDRTIPAGRRTSQGSRLHHARTDHAR